MSVSRETSRRIGRPRQRVRSDIKTEAEYEHSESSSSSSVQRASSSRSRIKKRKVEKYTSDLQPRVKRLKPCYNDQYRQLYNTTVNDIASKNISKEDPLPPSQIGVTIWSSDEKATFFSVLARRGRHDIKGIAAEIGSKSESEVHTYLELLQNATADQNAHAHRKTLLKIDDIEPAVEVSQECCVALDLAAEALSVLQQKEDDKLETQKFANFSLLTPKLAKWADRALLVGEEGEREVLKALPAAALLDLKAFLTVSKRFFMNSRVTENNWRTYTEKRKSPSITYTAFSDMHTLAVSLTRRLIQSSLFFAMSRIRAMNTSGRYTPENHIKQRDVVAALNVLGMEVNGRKVWIGTARKCRLQVYENVRRRQARGKRYSYDEVEAFLSEESLGSRGRYRTRSGEGEDAPQPQTNENNAPPVENVPEESASSVELSTGDSDSSLSDDPSDTEPSPSHTSKHAYTQLRLEQAEDAYLEAHDQKGSSEEEKCLWELLGEDPAAKMDLSQTDLPRVPRRANREAHTDWTTWLNYGAEWEKFETLVPANSFVENRRLGKTQEEAEELTDVEEIEEDAGEESSRSRKALSNEFVGEDDSEEESEAIEYGDDSGGDGDGSGGRRSRHASRQSTDARDEEASPQASSSSQNPSFD